MGRRLRLGRDKFGIERNSPLKFNGGFLFFSQLTKCDRQFEVGGRVICDRPDGSAKLRDGSVEIAGVSQSAA
jgi:hypothetical protein